MNPILALAALAMLSSKKRQAGKPVVGDGKTTAFLYQLADDGYTTTRVAISAGGDDPREVGIFDTPQKAIEIARGNGWDIAHGGAILQLAKRPEG